MRVGVDIGGTFTDFFLIGEDGRTVARKFPSTPGAPEQAVIEGMKAILTDAGLACSDVVEIVHGTTVGSNTLLQKRGARTGLITTKGFRDVLEIGRLRTPSMFDLQWEKPEPLVRRRHRLEVAERIAADGTVLTPLDESAVEIAARQLVDDGVESVAICFINSYRNPDHENRASDLVAGLFPTLRITTSVSVLPEAKEYERTSTTVVNAYVAPILEEYLARLEDGMASIGIKAPLLVGNSNGALASSGTARSRPVFFISSGRAAGAVGGSRLGEALALRDMVVFDMGGTTASASLVRDGELSRVSEYEFRAGISTPSRFIKAGGYMMSVPTVDVAEVGSGAGSIAQVDGAGLIKVGPQSAGAEPGPACYGHGGNDPTVTDANLVLGYLPSTLGGGTHVLSQELAQNALRDAVSTPLNLDVTKAAYGVREVVNANMARAIRAVTVERGVDPRDFTLVAIGGSGPVHAAAIAALLQIPRLIIPASPGVFTAMGMLAGDIERYQVAPFTGLLDKANPVELEKLSDSLEALIRDELAREDVKPEDMRIIPELNLRFRGQEMTLAVAVEGKFDKDDIRERFLSSYRSIYSYSSSDSIETVSLRITGRGTRPGRLDFQKNFHSDDSQNASAVTHRNVYFGAETGWLSTPVYLRNNAVRNLLGPCIIEGQDSTVVVPPRASVEADSYSNLHITLA